LYHYGQILEEEMAMLIEVIESVTKTIGSLALAYPYLRHLQVAETIESVTIKGKGREVPTGQVIEALILNRLSLRPAPISKVGGWAKTQAVEEVYGFVGEALNDDRIGRALDEIHPHLMDLWASIVVKGAESYGIRLDRLHSDVTRLAFEGDYDDIPTVSATGQRLPRINHGFTGKEDPSRKQVTLSLSVAADGGVPAWFRVADGNAADNQVYPAHLAAVRERLHLDKPLVVGDSKLITRPNMLSFCRVGARFIGPTGLTDIDRTLLLSLWQRGEPMHQLEEVSEEEAARRKKKGLPICRYWGLEAGEPLLDGDRGSSYPLRRLFVQSLEDRKAARHQRAKDLARAHRELWGIKGRLGRPAYRDRTLLERKVTEALTKVKHYLGAEILDTGQGLDLRWHLDHRRLREEARFDGLYCLLTNQTHAEATLQGVFLAYKGQSQVEGRFRVVKHPPIQVRPIWLHQPQRIESLIFVVMVALFLFALIEREARRVVEESGELFTGLRPEGRDKLPVTAARLFEVFAPLNLVRQRLRVADEVAQVVTPATLTPLQAQILDRLRLMRPEVYLQPTVSPHPL
jgi:transposase